MLNSKRGWVAVGTRQMMRSRRRFVLIGLAVALVVVTPVVVLGVGRFSAFDIVGQDDPLGDPKARIDLVACFVRHLDRFAPDDVVEEVLLVRRDDGSFDMPPGVDGFSFDSAGDGERDVLKVDFYGNASDDEVSGLVQRLEDRPEIATVRRRARPSDCRNVAPSESTTTTG